MIELGMTHLQAALTIHLYSAGMVSLGFWMPAMDATQAFLILLGAAFSLPAVVWVAGRLLPAAAVDSVAQTS